MPAATFVIRRRSYSRQRGMSLLEVAVALAVAAIAVAAIIGLMSDSARALKDQAAAEQMRFVASAARDYMTARGTTVAAPSVITGEQLRDQGFLPPGFTGLNPYGQSYRLLVRQAPGGALDAVVVTVGGQAIRSGSLGKIAAMVGAEGGYVSGGTVVGSYGGWRSSADLWASTGVTPAEGAVAATLGFDGRVLAADYLYRGAVPGRPEANRMRVDLDMAQNDVRNVDELLGRTADLTEDARARRNVLADLDVMANRDISAIRKVTAGSDVTAGGRVAAAGDVQAGGGLYGRSVESYGTLKVAREATLAGSLDVTGTATLGTVYGREFYYSSDGDLKQDLAPIADPLRRLLSIRGLSYQWRDSGKPDIGVLAQDVAAAFPELAARRADGTLAVKYGNLMGPVIESVRQLHMENVALRFEMRLRAGERLTPEEAAFLRAMRESAR